VYSTHYTRVETLKHYTRTHARTVNECIQHSNSPLVLKHSNIRLVCIHTQTTLVCPTLKHYTRTHARTINSHTCSNNIGVCPTLRQYTSVYPHSNIRLVLKHSDNTRWSSNMRACPTLQLVCIHTQTHVPFGHTPEGPSCSRFLSKVIFLRYLFYLF
jgi:hypothetical protein